MQRRACACVHPQAVLLTASVCVEPCRPRARRRGGVHAPRCTRRPTSCVLRQPAGASLVLLEARPQVASAECFAVICELRAPLLASVHPPLILSLFYLVGARTCEGMTEMVQRTGHGHGLGGRVSKTRERGCEEMVVPGQRWKGARKREPRAGEGEGRAGAGAREQGRKAECRTEPQPSKRVSVSKMGKLVWLAAVVALTVPSASAAVTAANPEGENRTLMDKIVRYNWKLCDQCSDNANDLCYAQGIIRGRKNRRRCDWAPCDPNNDKVNNRGWFCEANSDAVLMPQGSKQDARDVGRGNGFALETSHPANKPAGALLIPPQQALYCVPCNRTVNGWCDPYSGNACDDGAVCRSCDKLFPGEDDVKGRGWTCSDRSDSPQVCVNANGMVHIDVTSFAVTDATTGAVSYKVPRSAYASTIITKRCKDTPFCLWGMVAGMSIVSIVIIADTIFGRIVHHSKDFAATMGTGTVVLDDQGMFLIDSGALDWATIPNGP